MAKIYKPIPKIGTGRFSFQVAIRTRLYAGPDHLLVVQNTGYTEEYKRVAYADIRYLIVEQNYGQMQIGMISGGLVLMVFLTHFFGLPWLAVSIAAVPFIIWFVANILLGPSCRCYLNTHVQTIQLPAPRRLNKIPIFRAFLQSAIPSSRAVGEQSMTA